MSNTSTRVSLRLIPAAIRLAALGLGLAFFPALGCAQQPPSVGGFGGQRADPNFKTTVDKPAYAGATKHPRILFDEAHHNFHTSGGRYKPFADLIKNDGYEVIPNSEKFSRDVLKKGDILLIANALGAEGMGQPGSDNPAFTDAECAAVRDWIKDGGSLLLISDHAPMGAAAECLAKSLGVSMSKGATSDPSHSEGGDTSLVFTRQNQLLGDHPITRGRDESERVNRVQTFTGTSVKGPDGSVPILKLADTAMDLAMGEGQPASAAGRAQGVAFSLGKGRVVVMGEAAELSAQLIGDEKFGMNVPGRSITARWACSTSCTGSRGCSSHGSPRSRKPADGPLAAANSGKSSARLGQGFWLSRRGFAHGLHGWWRSSLGRHLEFQQGAELQRELHRQWR